VSKIKLDKNTNYIVSGLERSGTSLMMQILEASGIPVAYDELRKPDENNPRGYYELSGGKIIDELRKGTFPLDKYKGKFIKITAWGLKYLPPDGDYDIIYMIRDVDEIVESTIKMGKDGYDKKKLRRCLIDFTRETLNWLEDKSISFIPISYGSLLDSNPSQLYKDNQDTELKALALRYGCKSIVSKGKKVIDKKLYRSRING